MAEKRKPLSKKQRFDIFKRDSFTCQYCGRHPPEIVLEVDHMKAVKDGGSNEDHNLITSCFDCNRGKAAGSLAHTALSVSERAAQVKDRMEQAEAYDQLLRKEKALRAADVENICFIYGSCFEEWSLTDTARQSISNFLKLLPAVEVEEAMEIACARRDAQTAFKYFCGICWRKIKGN